MYERGVIRSVAAAASYIGLMVGGGTFVPGIWLTFGVGNDWPFKLWFVFFVGGGATLAASIIAQVWLHRTREQTRTHGFDVIPMSGGDEKGRPS